MMTRPLFTTLGRGDTAVNRAIKILQQAGYQVMRSFDLNAARATHADCSCPHHGTALCDCQMVVLLVYGESGPPVTLTAHSRDGRTQFALVDDPAQRPSSNLENDIINLLLPAFLSHPPLEVHLV
ncbi:MAG: hypothetical protein ACE5E7_18540 [Anaerolineae bacterium]